MIWRFNFSSVPILHFEIHLISKVEYKVFMDASSKATVTGMNEVRLALHEVRLALHEVRLTLREVGLTLHEVGLTLREVGLTPPIFSRFVA